MISVYRGRTGKRKPPLLYSHDTRKPFFSLQGAPPHFFPSRCKTDIPAEHLKGSKVGALGKVCPNVRNVRAITPRYVSIEMLRNQCHLIHEENPRLSLRHQRIASDTRQLMCIDKHPKKFRFRNYNLLVTAAWTLEFLSRKQLADRYLI